MRFFGKALHCCVRALSALVLLAALAAPHAQAAGVVNPCTEASLDLALIGGGSVTFACSGSIAITAQKVISNNTTIDGAGQTVTLNGGNNTRIFVVDLGGSLSLSSLTLTGGKATDANGGGAIQSSGTLTITNSTISNSTATGTGGGGAIAIGGGSLTLTDSTISGNSAANLGGAINSGLSTLLTIQGSTFSGNSSTLSGGALAINPGGNMQMRNSTFSGNSAVQTGGAVFSSGFIAVVHSTFLGNSAPTGGSAIFRNLGSTIIQSSILAAGTGTVCGGTVSDGGYNLIADASCGVAGVGSVQNVTPVQFALGALGSNGGPTQTIPLLPGSVAINIIPLGANNCGIGFAATDQRGIARPQNVLCDVGAYELRQTAVVGDGSALSCSFANLQSAFLDSNVTTITFNCPIPTTITFTSTIALGRSVTINGSGQLITFSGNNSVRLFSVNGGGAPNFQNLTFSAGNSSTGAAIQVASGATANFTNVTFANNAATNNGGAIHNSGTANITNGTFFGNSASNGGGAIFSSGTVSITNATFSGNTSAPGGSAIMSSGGTATIRNSILASGTGALCSGAITNGGYNLTADSSCGFAGLFSQQDVTPAQLALGTLGFYGGNTQTFPLQPGSIAINAIFVGPNCGAGVAATDQRGFTRPQGGACDIGAYEVKQVVVGDGSAPSCTFTALESAVNDATVEVITFNCPLPTTITFTSTIAMNHTVIVDGGGQDITLRANSSSRQFIINSGATVTLNNLTFSEGTVLAGTGGAISIKIGGIANISNSTFRQNFASQGGAIDNGGTASVTNTTFSSNSSATEGGAIRNVGTINITNSTFSGNLSDAAGGVIYNLGAANITNSTFSGNTAGGPGGAIQISGGTVNITNSTFFDSESPTNGAAIFTNGGVTSIINSTFIGNRSPSGGTVSRNLGTLTLRNSILANLQGPECVGTITDGGYNLAQGTTCGFSGTSQQNVTAQQLALGALESNGGPTQTILPGKGSIAIDRIPAGANCGPGVAATDQRGVARPQHGNCDVGAAEVEYRVLPRLVSE